MIGEFFAYVAGRHAGRRDAMRRQRKRRALEQRDVVALRALGLVVLGCAISMLLLVTTGSP